jgi:putative peptidoglycan lipid II flippase
LATVILPSLSHKHAEESKEGFSHTLNWALRWVLFLGVPCGVGLFILAGPMIATLFQSQVFHASDVAMAQRSLMAYSLGLVPFILIKVLAPGYYARQDTKSPVRIAIYAMLTNMVFNIILVFPLAHAGLALATTMSACLNATMLFRGLRREGVLILESGWASLILRGLAASVVMGAILYILGGDLDSWVSMDLWGRIWRLLLLILYGVVAYFIALMLLGIRLRHFRPAKSS